MAKQGPNQLVLPRAGVPNTAGPIAPAACQQVLGGGKRRNGIHVAHHLVLQLEGVAIGVQDELPQVLILIASHQFECLLIGVR